MTHLTGFSGFPARRALRCDAGHHKRGATLSGKPENPAFGGSNRSTGSVAMLVRCPASHGAPRLPGRTDLTHEMGHYHRYLVLAPTLRRHALCPSSASRRAISLAR